MGALLASAVPRLRCPEEANLRAPESVVDVHVGYIRAGAELIETNTFGANRPKLAQHFLEDEFEAINNAAVRLAREAREIAGPRRLHRRARSARSATSSCAAASPRALYAEQAAVLEGRGVDLFMVETFYDLDDLETAIAAVRSVSQLPIVALMTLRRRRADARRRLARRGRASGCAQLDVAAFGANHGAGPGRGAARARGDAGRRARPRGAAERRPREHVGPADRLPARDARVLRRVRGAGARARRRDRSAAAAARRRRRSRRSAPRSTRTRRPSRLAARARARARDRPVSEPERADAAAAAARRRRVRRLGAARPAARRERGRRCSRRRARSASRARRSSSTSTTTRVRVRA